METDELINLIDCFYIHMKKVYDISQEEIQEYIPATGIERLVQDFGRVRKEKFKYEGTYIEVVRFKALYPHSTPIN